MRELLSLDAQVHYFNERPFTSSIAKILNRLNCKILIKKTIKQHYDAILKKATSEQYDILFVVNPETMTGSFIREVKSRCKGIRTILYLWDSIVNKKNSLPLIGYFDKVVTFDERDSKIDPRIDFLPLFYCKIYDSTLIDWNGVIDYDATFIGTAHSDRYAFVKSVINQVVNTASSNYLFFYCPSRLLFFLKKLLTKELALMPMGNVSFKSMCAEDVVSILKRTNVVIDSEHPMQHGLTMRTIETLGLQKKLITTNKSITSYDFYHPNNILVVDRDNPVIDNGFFMLPYQPIEGAVRDKYSLRNWLQRLFD